MQMSMKGPDGERELKKRLLELAKAFPEAAAAALYQEGFALHAEAVRRAPVEFGVLRSSAYTAPPTMSGGEPIVEVGFGTKYAVPQHEHTEYRHPRGGEAKYLENAVNARMSGFLSRLAARIQENAAHGVTARSIPAQAPTRPKV